MIHNSSATVLVGKLQQFDLNYNYLWIETCIDLGHLTACQLLSPTQLELIHVTPQSVMACPTKSNGHPLKDMQRYQHNMINL